MATDGREQLDRLEREAQEMRLIRLAFRAESLEIARRARLRREDHARQDSPDNSRRPDDHAAPWDDPRGL